MFVAKRSELDEVRGRFDAFRVTDKTAHHEMRALGPPTYYPRYMVQHGMAAIRGTGAAPLVANFDPQAAWVETIDGYGRCSGVAPREKSD